MIAIYETETGLVRRCVQCPEDEIEHNVQGGESYIYVDAHLMEPHKVVDGALVALLRPAPTYTEQRASAYPALGDQLGAIWKTLAKLDPAQLDPDTLAVLRDVQAVKEQYPVEKANNTGP
ncbi:hypothetical protein [Ralstonia solanacearum]|uniref:hypothetical protein n=1 Tax=Ralstonia solanacearum TaxID=305 RepID=UPI0005AC556A|nr:hypothetical protein [Ralstonia solanacearum]